MSWTSPALPASMPDRYFEFLGTPYHDAEGNTRQPAKGRFIDLLKTTHASYRPRHDLSACLRGAQKGFKGQVWFWSDLHISHANIIRYCQRPFADIEVMNDVLIKNCLAKVTAEDILVFGGDVTMNDLAVTNAFLRKVPAYKVLVLGNHDMGKNGMLPLAMDEVAACLELDHEGRSVFVSHYPLAEQLLPPGGLNLHGHIHNTPLPPALGNGRRHANMSVETIAFEPRTLKELLAFSGA